MNKSPTPVFEAVRQGLDGVDGRDDPDIDRAGLLEHASSLVLADDDGEVDLPGDVQFLLLQLFRILPHRGIAPEGRLAPHPEEVEVDRVEHQPRRGGESPRGVDEQGGRIGPTDPYQGIILAMGLQEILDRIDMGSVEDFDADPLEVTRVRVVEREVERDEGHVAGTPLEEAEEPGHAERTRILVVGRDDVVDDQYLP